MLLALILVVLVLARRGRLEALTINKVKLERGGLDKRPSERGIIPRMRAPEIGHNIKSETATYPEEPVILLPQVNFAISALSRTTRANSICISISIQ